MKRDRGSIPVLHFNSPRKLEQFLGALGGTMDHQVKLSEYGIDLPEILYTCSFRDSSFSCVTSSIPNNMCQSAQQYNEIFSQMLPEMKLLLSIDNTGEYAGAQVNRHSDECRFPVTHYDVLNYLDIAPAAIENEEVFREACMPERRRLSPPQEFFQRMVFLIGNGGGDLSEYPPIESKPPPKKLKIDKKWEDQIVTDETKLKTEVDPNDLKCGICVTFVKSFMLMPCEHLFLCDVCFKQLMEHPEAKKICPICRDDFTNAIRIDL